MIAPTIVPCTYWHRDNFDPPGIPPASGADELNYARLAVKIRNDNMQYIFADNSTSFEPSGVVSLKTAKPYNHDRPIPKTHTSIAAPVAITAARIAAAGIKEPSIAMLVRVAKIPPAGVKAPYMYD
ncbi:hypothetical protein CFAM422_001556 [Trichoderma lentiforme]|uniref:Uncharacterized protein n=1 Tax=Trichoderma lentiforme TaxID=1567552 RepID=A0A9P4XLC9_9HYPO|nr:hypothetical protein CFAM422_001556 [Trichoderma lentiforme]